jgi:UrcA family protein
MNFCKELTMTRYSILAAFLATTVLTAGAAQAQNDIMVVRIGDLNVSSTQGAQVALHRIKSAAAQFCSDADSRDLGRIAQHRACETRMVGKAVRSLDAPVVTALYAPSSSFRLASETTR